MSSVSCELAPELFCGGCCVDVRLALYEDEAARLRQAGTDLTEALPVLALTQLEVAGSTIQLGKAILLSWADRDGQDALKRQLAGAKPENKDHWQRLIKQSRGLKPGQGLFNINGRCGFLRENGSCEDYTNRPEICQEFQPGSDGCIHLKNRPIVAVPVEIVKSGS